MPTVRRPSSLAARKMLIAISLRLAARSFCIVLIFGIQERAKRRAKLYIVSRPGQEAAAVFSMRPANQIYGEKAIAVLANKSVCSEHASARHLRKARSTSLARHFSALPGPLPLPALTGGATAFNCRNSASTLLHSLGFRLVA